MINYKIIDISTLDDYNKIEIELDKKYNSRYTKIWIDEIKNKIGLKCSQLLLEFPYYDSEYLSSFYSYYSKKFAVYEKDSCRIHLLHNNLYYGFISIRPTTHYLNLGKSYISPSLFGSSQYIMLSKFCANLLGSEYEVWAFPWMHQETDVSICAHIATWNILKYFGNEHKNFRDVTLGEIVNNTPENGNRKIPSKGLNLQQIADIFRVYNITPLVIRKKNIIINDTDEDCIKEQKKLKQLGYNKEFKRELLSYIESGIPVVGAMFGRAHAITIIGHGKLNKATAVGSKGKYLFHDSSEYIDSIIVNDDNYLPYMEIESNTSSAKSPYFIEDIDFAVVPLYDRIYFEFTPMYERVKKYLEKGHLNIPKEAVIRAYITSSNSLKKKSKQCVDMNSNLKKVIINLNLPKFVWCIDISSIDNYNQEKICARLVIDSTSCTYEESPWLIVHDGEKIMYNDGKTPQEQLESIIPYTMYKNNLREV